MRIIDKEKRDVLAPSPVVELTGRVLISRLPNIGNQFLLPSSNLAYFVYLGRTTKAITAKFVEFYVNTAGSTSTAGEVGLFSTASPPNKVGQSLTKLAYASLNGTGSAPDSLLSTGLKRNLNSLDYGVPAGTYLWAGIRIAMTTQPYLAGLTMDFLEGMVQATSSAASAFTTAGPWQGAIIQITGYYYSAICPDLRINMD